MRRPIGNVLLRNEYSVYECADCYDVAAGSKVDKIAGLELDAFVKLIA